MTKSNANSNKRTWHGLNFSYFRKIKTFKANNEKSKSKSTSTSSTSSTSLTSSTPSPSCTSIKKSISFQTGRPNPIQDWESYSVSEFSKYFRVESSSSEINLKTDEKNISAIKEKEDENATDVSSSIYQPTIELCNNEMDTQQVVYEINRDIENLCPQKQKYQSKFIQKLDKLFQLQWSKLIGIVIVLGGMIIGVLSATIYAIQQESNGEFRHVNNSVFGKQFRNLVNIRTSMVDPDTPKKFKSWNSSLDDEWTLVFSDEFNCENRTFYPGDDQFWEAVDLHYAATNNMEWLDPAHVTTKEGAVRITMEQRESHGLNYTSGMLQSWNKVCFTQGYVETSIRMPGNKDAIGLWPAFWSLGNIARAGYMASTEGTWPYSYDSCDIGVTANQSSNDGLSWLPGQKLNSCICKGEDHPNPGTARAAPEIDIMEGLYDNYSQTLNIAPFDIWRYPDYDHIAISNLSTTAMNPFMGTEYQEAVSAVVDSNPDWYDNGNFVKFGMEYRNDMKNREHNYINFYVNDQITFRITESAFHPDGNIDWRTISKEPMSLIMNLGLSTSWSKVNVSTIQFPVYMDIDYVRIYQPKDTLNLTCDPKNFPTKEYIDNHFNAYSNSNLTSWEMAGYKFPEFSLNKKCSKKH